MVRRKVRTNKSYSVKSPSKYLSLAFLQGLQDSYYITESGLEYDVSEVDSLVYEKLEAVQVKREKSELDKFNKDESLFTWTIKPELQVETCDKLDLIETISLTMLHALKHKVILGEKVLCYGLPFDKKDLDSLKSEIENR